MAPSLLKNAIQSSQNEFREWTRFIPIKRFEESKSVLEKINESDRIFSKLFDFCANSEGSMKLFDELHLKFDEIWNQFSERERRTYFFAKKFMLVRLKLAKAREKFERRELNARTD